MIINRVTLLGHKDHGKSTLIGSMLITTKSVSEERINEAKGQSRKLGRKFEPGFILDSFSEERKGGLTIDTSRAQVKFRDSAFEFIDVPGHEELIKNMISGASYAKFALLMISANKEEGIRPQTKRHLFLAKMLGIGRLIVAVNKMDTVGYDKERFEEIKEEISAFLDRIGISRDQVHFVPISAYNMENLAKSSPNMKWYSGKPLLEVMREMTKEKSAASGTSAVRVILQGSMNHGKSPLLLGRVVSGTLRAGQKIRIMPSASTGIVKSIFVKGARKANAKIGENVAVSLDKAFDADPKGMVMYEGAKGRIGKVRGLNALVFIVKRLNKNVTLKFNGIDAKGSLSIKELIDTTTGNGDAKAPQELNAANTNIRLQNPLAAEPFSDSRDLGRFVIYQGKEFCGIGIINSVS